jgi:hypothetical protein
MQSCQSGTIIEIMHKREKRDDRFHKIKKIYEVKQTWQTNFSSVRTVSFSLDGRLFIPGDVLLNNILNEQLG